MTAFRRLRRNSSRAFCALERLSLRLADIYKAAYELWQVFRGDLERNARSEELDMKIVHKISDESYHLDHYMAEAWHVERLPPVPDAAPQNASKGQTTYI